MTITINFDMDGTIAGFYDVPNWLDYLEKSDTTPYEIAKPLLRMNTLARYINKLQSNGYKINIISWTSKTGSQEFNERIAIAKKKWLKQHMPSVQWNEINIIPYGTPKQKFAHSKADILFDDEKRNRDNWTGLAFDVDDILEVLKEILYN